MAFVRAFSTIPEIGAAIWTVIHRRGDFGEDATDCPAVKAGEGLFVTGLLPGPGQNGRGRLYLTYCPPR